MLYIYRVSPGIKRSLCIAKLNLFSRCRFSTEWSAVICVRVMNVELIWKSYLVWIIHPLLKFVLFVFTPIEYNFKQLMLVWLFVGYTIWKLHKSRPFSKDFLSHMKQFTPSYGWNVWWLREVEIESSVHFISRKKSFCSVSRIYLTRKKMKRLSR